MDNPNLSAKECIKLSNEMMMGYKWKLFVLYLSFIGWALLAVLTLFIGYLWLYPYIYATFAAFYLDVKKNYESKNLSGNSFNTNVLSES